MNHVTQLNKLLQQIRLYKMYLSICPDHKISALCIEILKLQNRVEILNQMQADELRKQVLIQYETKQSKMNFISHI